MWSHKVKYKITAAWTSSKKEKNVYNSVQLIPWCTHLQWTTIGPASRGLQAFTRRRKARMGVGYSGTPWSGQAINWNCLTSLFSLEPFCNKRIRWAGLEERALIGFVGYPVVVNCKCFIFIQRFLMPGKFYFNKKRSFCFDEKEMKLYS